MKYCEFMIRDYSVIPSGIGSGGIISKTNSTTSTTSSNTDFENDCKCVTAFCEIMGLILLLAFVSVLFDSFYW